MSSNLLLLLRQTWDVPVVTRWLNHVVRQEIMTVDWHDDDLALRTATGTKRLHDGLAVKLLDRADPDVTVPVVWFLLSTLDHRDESHEVLSRFIFTTKIPAVRFLWFPGSFRAVVPAGTAVKSGATMKPLDNHDVAVKIPFTIALHRHLKSALLIRLYGVDAAG
jgi:hypothetical protein